MGTKKPSTTKKIGPLSEQDWLDETKKLVAFKEDGVKWEREAAEREADAAEKLHLHGRRYQLLQFALHLAGDDVHPDEVIKLAGRLDEFVTEGRIPKSIAPIAVIGGQSQSGGVTAGKANIAPRVSPAWTSNDTNAPQST